MEYQQQVLIDGEGVFPLLRHVRLRGTNFEIGRQLAEINIANHGDRLEKHRAADPVYARARRRYFQEHYPILWQRMQGVAAAFDADAEDDRYDFSSLKYNVDLPLRPGCSNAFYPPHRTADGHAYLSRNYDFSTGSLSDLVGLQLSPEVRAQMKAMMGEPYIMEWQPTDGGYASWAMHSNDVLGGTFDGINSAGLAVALMADEEAMGVVFEPHSEGIRAVGVDELQILRMLLDTCATVDEAKALLLTVKQFYQYVPCHYIIADASGKSFVFENSMGRNHSVIIDGSGEAQVCTNHEVHRHPVVEMPRLTLETNSQWRYATLESRIAAQQKHTPEDIRANNLAVGVRHLSQAMKDNPGFRSIAVSMNARTLWYALYDLTERRVEIDFFLNSTANDDGTYNEDRSPVYTYEVTLAAEPV